MLLAGYLTWLTFLYPVQVSPPMVEVIEAQKPAYRAYLDTLLPESAWIIRDSQRLQIANSNLLSLQFLRPASRPAEAVFRLQLTDGSEIACSAIESDGKQFMVGWSDQQTEIAVQHAHTLRLRELNKDQQGTWDAISQSVVSSDVLCLVQPNGAITKIEGIISGISQDAVRFEFGGQKIDVPFTKLAGIRFYSKAGTPREKLQVVVVDRAGNTWMATRLASVAAKSSVEIRLQCGATVELALQELHSLDFSFGSQVYLADLEPVQRSVPTLFDLAVDIPAEKMLFGAGGVAPRDVPGRALGPSLQFLGSGEAWYRIPEGFQRLVGSVELRPTGEKFTVCRVQILLENKVLWDQKIAQPQEPMDIDIPVASDQRLRLMVTADASFPTGDVVLWRELRLLK